MRPCASSVEVSLYTPAGADLPKAVPIGLLVVFRGGGVGVALEVWTDVLIEAIC